MLLKRLHFVQLLVYCAVSFVFLYMLFLWFPQSSFAILSPFRPVDNQNQSASTLAHVDNVTEPSLKSSSTQSSSSISQTTLSQLLTSLKTSDAFTSIQTLIRVLSSSSPVSSKPSSSPSSNSSFSVPLSLVVTSQRTVITSEKGAATNQSQKLACHGFTGRLGNELFQFASTLGIAFYLNRKPVFPGNFGLLSILKTSPKYEPGLQAELGKRCSSAKSANEASANKFDDRLMKLDPNHDYWVGIYLQSWRYFERHKEEVRRALIFNDDITKEANNVVQNIRKEHANATLIGVHIRRGDFESNRNVGLGYPMATPEFINSSTTHFLRLFTDSVFVVASENMQWCKDNFPKNLKIVFLDPHSPPVDMMILASTDHIITTFGSYSWWAGYLNKGIVAYMKDYIKPNTYVARQFDLKREDYMYPGWIPL